MKITFKKQDGLNLAIVSDKDTQKVQAISAMIAQYYGNPQEWDETTSTWKFHSNSEKDYFKDVYKSAKSIVSESI